MFYGLRKLPYVTAGFGIDAYGWPLHIAMAITGSVSVLFLSRKLPAMKWLQFWGRNSLVVYLTQGATLSFLIAAFNDTLSKGGIQTSVVTVLVIAISVCAVATVVAYLIDRTPLRLLMGKSISAL